MILNLYTITFVFTLISWNNRLFSLDEASILIRRALDLLFARIAIGSFHLPDPAATNRVCHPFVHSQTILLTSLPVLDGGSALLVRKARAECFDICGRVRFTPDFTNFQPIEDMHGKF